MPRNIVLDQDLHPCVTQTPDVPLGDAEVRVEVTRAGVNFWEIMQRTGRVPVPPSGVPGSEGVGVVVELGPGVTGVELGARVAWSKVPGSYSDSVVAPAAAITLVPDEVDDDTAASLLFQGSTAAYLCEETWPVNAGDVVIVTSASGGVGLLLTQLLVARGAKVIGVVSSHAKAGASLRAGASHVLTYGDTLPSEVLGLHPDGVAAVFDGVGAGVAEPLLGTLRPRGAMVLYGSASGHEAAISAGGLSKGSLFLTRAAGRDYMATPEKRQAYARKLLNLAAEGRLHAEVDSVLPLADAAKAWASLESRSNVGKVLLAP